MNNDQALDNPQAVSIKTVITMMVGGAIAALGLAFLVLMLLGIFM